MTTPKKPQGFAAMSLEKRRAIASRGGKSAHAKGTAHVWTAEEAAEAGASGGTHRGINQAARKAAQAAETRA